MRIIYTKHALNKFSDLAVLGIHISKHKVQSVLQNPQIVDKDSDYPNSIATGKLDRNHVLRVVYREENDTIVIVTFYPGRKERYL